MAGNSSSEMSGGPGRPACSLRHHSLTDALGFPHLDTPSATLQCPGKSSMAQEGPVLSCGEHGSSGFPETGRQHIYFLSTVLMGLVSLICSKLYSLYAESLGVLYHTSI